MELTLSDSEIVISPKFDKVLQQQNYRPCQTCGLHYLKNCSFCDNDNPKEEFEFSSSSSLFTTQIIIDIEFQKNIELTNAGISDYDQERHAKLIQTLIDKEKQPHEIAIELGYYTQRQLHDYITEEVNKMKQKKGTILLDLISMSSSQSYQQIIMDKINSLNRENIKITHTNKPQEKLKELFSENTLMEIIYITNQNRDLGKQQSNHILNCICLNIDPLQYKNICRLNSGKSIKLEEQLGECLSRIKIVINKPNVFVDYDSNVAYISNFDLPLQIQSTGTYVIQCHSMSTHIYQRKYQGPQSESINLTKYSKI